MVKQIVMLLVLAAAAEVAQTPAAAPSPQSAPAPAASMPEATAQDVDTIDHVVAALYDVISGPPGPRDWNRFKSLFIAEARLIPNGVRDGAAFHRVLTVDEFAQRSGQSGMQNGFFENETARKQERFGGIAHVFSTYESRREKGGQPFAKGINSIQLLWDGKRWYIVTVLWDSERPDNPIPAEYQKK